MYVVLGSSGYSGKISNPCSCSTTSPSGVKLVSRFFCCPLPSTTLFRRRSSSSKFIHRPSPSVCYCNILFTVPTASFFTSLCLDSVHRIKFDIYLVRCYASQNTFFQNTSVTLAFIRRPQPPTTVINLTADAPHCFTSEDFICLQIYS